MGGGVVRRRSRYIPPSVSSVEAANIWISGTRVIQTTRPACCEAFFLSDSNSGRAAFKHPGHVTVEVRELLLA